jgi:hypothetical protein
MHGRCVGDAWGSSRHVARWSPSLTLTLTCECSVACRRAPHLEECRSCRTGSWHAPALHRGFGRSAWLSV